MPATIKDLSETTGLSIGTISKYLNGVKIKPKNEIILKTAIEELDYTVNAIARGLKTNKSMTIGVLIPSIKDVFNTAIIHRVEQLLSDFGYNIMLCDYNLNTAQFEEKVNLLLGKNVDAIIMVPDEKSKEVIEKAQKRVPVIFVDCLVDDVRCDAVLTDSFESSFKATQYLILNGHKKTLIILGRPDSSTSQERLRGYLEAHRNHGIEIDYNLIKYGDYSLNGGYKATISMLESNLKCTAIFATNYYMTMGAIMAMNEKNINIPNDYSFIGFDQIEMAAICKPPLFIVEQPMEEISHKVVEILLKRLNGDYGDMPLIEKLKAKLNITDGVKNINT